MIYNNPYANLQQSICKRCGRKLKNKQAIEIGMGAICLRKYQSENNHKKLLDKINEENNNE